MRHVKSILPSALVPFGLTALLLAGLVGTRTERADAQLQSVTPTTMVTPTNTPVIQDVSGFRLRRLDNATPEEVGRYAVEWAQSAFVVTGTLQVRLARHITANQMPSLGLPQIGFAGQEPPLTLVILRGDIDLADSLIGLKLRSPGSQMGERVEYLGVVFDRYAGAPTFVSPSRHGAGFRVALNDPSLPNLADLVPPPDFSQPDPPRLPCPQPPSPTTTPLPYGSTVPGPKKPFHSLPPGC